MFTTSNRNMVSYWPEMRLSELKRHAWYLAKPLPRGNQPREGPLTKWSTQIKFTQSLSLHTFRVVLIQIKVIKKLKTSAIADA